MDRPVIGIVGNLLIAEGGMFPGMERSYVNHDYVRAVALSGAVPMLLPPLSGADGVKEQLERVDGLLLSGGHDVDPLLYGEEPAPELGFILPEVDEYQLAVIRLGVRLGKPMLGICRGAQLLNVAFGGTLYQDIPQETGRVKHWQKSPRHVGGHTVQVASGSLLAHIFGKEAVLTNSFHHQAVKDIAPGFAISARAADGVIEGIERTGDAFVVGVQWHPEMMAEEHADMLALFRALAVAAAGDESRRAKAWDACKDNKGGENDAV